MKHVRPDRTFIFYYLQMWNGTYAGIKVGRKHVSVIAGSDPDPEKLAIQGKALSLPISGHTSGSFQNLRGQLVDQHPELECLLAGQIDFDEVADDSNCSDEESLRTLRRQTEQSRNFLTKQENKGDREKSVVAAFLRCVRADFVLDELQPGGDPPDIAYRRAAFEVTEILDKNRRRGHEWEGKLQKQKEAASLSDLKEPYRPPQEISMSELVQRTSESLAKKQQRYGIGTCKELDALVYVDLKDRLLNPHGNVPSLAPLATQGWRSVSFLMPPYAGTLYATSGAPDFLNQGEIRSASACEIPNLFKLQIEC